MQVTAKQIEGGFRGIENGKRIYRFPANGFHFYGTADENSAEFYALRHNVLIERNWDEKSDLLIESCALAPAFAAGDEVCYLIPTDDEHPDFDLNWLHQTAAAEINANLPGVCDAYKWQASFRWDEVEQVSSEEMAVIRNAVTVQQNAQDETWVEVRDAARGVIIMSGKVSQQYGLALCDGHDNDYGYKTFIELVVSSAEIDCDALREQVAQAIAAAPASANLVLGK